MNKGCADGERGWGRRTPQYYQICKKFGQKLARQQEEGWPQYFLWSFL